MTRDLRQIRDAGFAVPTDRPLGDVTADLTRMLGSTDPRLREEVAYAVLETWIERGVYDDLLAGLGDGIAAGLDVGIGEPDGDDVFRRSYSALVLSACLTRDTQVLMLPSGKILEWGDRLATWFLAEQDLRGWVSGKGWAHAIAHGADAIATLASSPHLGREELGVLLDVLADRVLQPTERLLSAGEPDRLALAAMHVLRRDLLGLEDLEPWVRRLEEGAPRRGRRRDIDPFLDHGNREAFLRALYLQLSLGPEPPPVRSDLLLRVVDALRVTNPRYLAARVEANS